MTKKEMEQRINDLEAVVYGMSQMLVAVMEHPFLGNFVNSEMFYSLYNFAELPANKVYNFEFTDEEVDNGN